MFLGKVPLPLHAVRVDAAGLVPNCRELADQIAEVTALHSAAKAHGRGIEEQHDGTIGEEPGQATRRTGLIGKLEISDDIAFAHDRPQHGNSGNSWWLQILKSFTFVPQPKFNGDPLLIKRERCLITDAPTAISVPVTLVKGRIR